MKFLYLALSLLFVSSIFADTVPQRPEFREGCDRNENETEKSLRSGPIGPTEILVGPDSDTVYILEQDACRICRTRFDGSDRFQRIDLPTVPRRMRWFPDRKRLAVVGGGPCGRLWIVNTAPFEVETEIPVGHSPSDVAVFQQDGRETILYVANRFDGDISVIPWSPETGGRETKRLPAGREPIALVVMPGGRELVVAGHLPEDSALDFNISSRIRFLDPETGESEFRRLEIGAVNLRDLLLDPDGRHVYATGGIGHFQRMPNDVTGGWMSENVLFVVDVSRRKVAGMYPLDDYGIGSANPWGISLSDEGRFLVVAAAGTGDVVLIPRRKFLETLDGSRVDDDLSKQYPLDDLLPFQMRISTGMKGVRHAVMSKHRLLATGYFDDAVARINPVFSAPTGFSPGNFPKDPLVFPRKNNARLRGANYWQTVNDRVPSQIVRKNDDKFEGVESVEESVSLRFRPLLPFAIAPGIRFERSFARLGPEPDWDEVRLGEMIFQDATLCKENWQSCATCHPDARSDTLNWDLLNDGQDNPKNTKSMLLSHDTPPSMATGVRAKAEIAVRKGFETILILPAMESEARAVDAYLSCLEPIPSPKRIFDRTKNDDQQGKLNPSAERGRLLFGSERTGCSTCHPEPLYTDLRKHHVGTQSAVDPEPYFDTPTLVEVWRTAPYLHDGRYTTVKQLIVEGKHVDTNGRLGRLTAEELDDLVEYVLSL